MGGREFDAEEVYLSERLIVAPQAGVFRSSVADDGAVIHEDEVLGRIERTWETFTVTSPHTGILMGLLATPGERVRKSQPLAWLRLPA
jgi:biotin carboxyl carrier protein